MCILTRDETEEFCECLCGLSLALNTSSALAPWSGQTNLGLSRNSTGGEGRGEERRGERKNEVCVSIRDTLIVNMQTETYFC